MAKKHNLGSWMDFGLAFFFIENPALSSWCSSELERDSPYYIFSGVRNIGGGAGISMSRCENCQNIVKILDNLSVKLVKLLLNGDLE